ncbi:MAG: MarR family transcriptional regulator [Bacteroidia bacterium]|jgi:DNA-binding MarR family transcriptional regulator|nr:MarR family transcriptional regulator [Bacteroidia bacterium]
MSKKKQSQNRNRRTGYLLWQVSNTWQRNIKIVLDPLDLTHVQYLLLETLEQLKTDGEPATQVKLAREAGTDVMMTSKVLRVLEQKKWVSRKANRADARAFHIALTPAGERVVSKARQLVNDADRNFFSSISKPEKFNDNLSSLAG